MICAPGTQIRDKCVFFFSISIFIFCVKLNNTSYGLITVCHMQNSYEVQVVRRTWRFYLHNMTGQCKRNSKKDTKNSHVCEKLAPDLTSWHQFQWSHLPWIPTLWYDDLLYKLAHDVCRHLAANSLNPRTTAGNADKQSSPQSRWQTRNKKW